MIDTSGFVNQLGVLFEGCSCCPAQQWMYIGIHATHHRASFVASVLHIAVNYTEGRGNRALVHCYFAALNGSVVWFSANNERKEGVEQCSV